MIEIKTAKASDITALKSLAAAMPAHKQENYFETCLAQQIDGKRLVFIMTHDGQDVGYGMLNWNPIYTLYRRLEIPEIQDIAVIPSARRQGIASALIAHCENLAREKNKTQIGISVGLHSDFGAAQRLYVRLGYIPDGNGVTYNREPVRPGEIRPVDDDLCLMMIKDLAP